MTKIFHYSPVFLMFLLALFSSCLAYAADVPAHDIEKAAKEGITTFLKDSRIGGLQRLGFETQLEIDRAALGAGFQIFTIHPDKLLNESNPQEIQSLATPTNQWQFLVHVGDKAKALLTVDLVDGKWVPVSIGSNGLAQELDGFLSAWPASSGYEFRLIRVYQAKSDFIELSHGSEVVGIIPLTSLSIATAGRAKGRFNPRDLHDTKDVLSSLRQIVKQNFQKVR